MLVGILNQFMVRLFAGILNQFIKRIKDIIIRNKSASQQPKANPVSRELYSIKQIQRTSERSVLTQIKHSANLYSSFCVGLSEKTQYER